jgi:hypothetical protein
MHAQTSVMYWLGTLVFDQLVSRTPYLQVPSAYSMGVGAVKGEEDGSSGTT